VRSSPPTDAPPEAAANDAAGAGAHAEHRAIWRFVRMLGASADEADDLAQETLVAALASERPQAPDAARAWLRGIARNQWLRTKRFWFRRREREIAFAVEELWLATADHDDGEELLVRLRDCLGGLQVRARRALELHYRDGLPWQHVATQVGLKPNGTKTLVQRARAALRACLERSEP
jgi:RNA polymerase sigma-70 factor (ECF subfamily)